MVFKINFSLKRNAKWSGETCGNEITVHLTECYNMRDIISTLIHESYHAAINEVETTNTDQDHFIMKKLEVDWF